MLISYEMLMRNFEELSQIKFDILVCDEGHRLKNNNIRTSVVSMLTHIAFPLFHTTMILNWK